MGRLLSYIRRAIRLLRLRSNPFATYQVVSDTPRGELEVVMANQDRVTISLRCKQVRPIPSRRPDDLHEVYEVSAACSDTAPEELRMICKTVLLYPRVRTVQMRGSDISEILIDHYLQVINYQLNGVNT